MHHARRAAQKGVEIAGMKCGRRRPDLANVLFLFYSAQMSHESPPPALSRSAIASAILSASPVVRLGLACPSEQLRERAADDLAGEIIEHLKAEACQLRLAL